MGIRAHQLDQTQTCGTRWASSEQEDQAISLCCLPTLTPRARTSPSAVPMLHLPTATPSPTSLQQSRPTAI
eukprot:2989032-Pyramimonas_sp.AAC.1